ncbi:MAG TPA: pilus assembly protein TadG-related protein [Terriglobales bacterium]|nr:pilus assembly protein TadG-related protein [Terriglobales bacterium]
MHPRYPESGQTILLVAASLVAILAMAALAIDVVTLYTARSEAQRAADAAAIAAAKMLADTGLTTDPCNAALATTAQTLATQQATVVAQQNRVAGLAAQTINVTFPNYSAGAGCPNAFGVNPQVTVNLQRTGLPTFFARLWSSTLASVSASATAEAYNPSNSSTVVAGPVAPVAPRCAKPLLLPNEDPNHAGQHFVDPTTGAIANRGLSGVVNNLLTLTSGCQPGFPTCNVNPNPPAAGTYVPLMMSPSALHICPSCGSALSGFASDLACCNAFALQCGQQYNLDLSVDPDGAGGAAQTGGQCLIHQSPGNGQDTVDATQIPPEITAGDNNPFVAGGTVAAGDAITNSDSIVMLPLFDDTIPFTGTGPVTIIGYLQVFIVDVDGTGTVHARVLNVIGCGNSLTGPPVQGSGASVPVRLIQQP